MDTARHIADARALLQAEAPEASDDTDSTTRKPEKPTPGEQDASVTCISQQLEQLALDTTPGPADSVPPPPERPPHGQPVPKTGGGKSGDTKDGHHKQPSS